MPCPAPDTALINILVRCHLSGEGVLQTHFTDAVVLIIWRFEILSESDLTEELNKSLQ